MIEVVVYGKNSNEVSELVRELRSQGLEPRRDFDFEFHPAKWDNFAGEEISKLHTVFRFYNERYATLFSLKHS
jgi:hypothetical protein